MYMEFNVNEENAGQKLGVFLRKMEVSASLLRSLKNVDMGLCVNGKNQHSNFILNAGDIVAIKQGGEDPGTIVPENIELDILYESSFSMIVNKPAGMVVHPTMSYKGGALANAFAYLTMNRGCQLPFRPIGRLDRNTSGLMLIAKTAYSGSYMQHKTEKTYIAAVHGSIKEEKAVINAAVGIKEGSIIEQCVREDGKESLSEYCLLARGEGVSLVKVFPKTGRTHQIRVHFSHIGHPLMGDSLYGGSTEHIGRHALHCAEMVFTEPGNEARRICAPMPGDMSLALDKCKIDWHDNL